MQILSNLLSKVLGRPPMRAPTGPPPAESFMLQTSWRPLGTLRGSKIAPRSGKERKSGSRALYIGSKSVQKRSKRLSRGLLRSFNIDAAIQTPCWSRFDIKMEDLEAEKSRFRVRCPQSCVLAAISARVAFETRFGTLPSSVLGAFGLQES